MIDPNEAPVGYSAEEPEHAGLCYGCDLYVTDPSAWQELKLCLTSSCHPDFRVDAEYVIFKRTEVGVAHAA